MRGLRSLLWACVLLAFAGSTQATVHFLFDAEAGSVGANVPNPPFCNDQCGATGAVGPVVDNAGGAPQGVKYFQWAVAANQHDHYNEVAYSHPILTASEGTTMYLAYWLRIDRQTGGSRFNVFQTGAGVQSAEKGTGLHGPNVGDGLRWDVSIGQWDSYAANSADHFTVWGGNPSHHLNPALEHNDVFYQNQNGYSDTNPIQLAYETWHAIVMEITASTGTGGTFRIWVNGTQVLSYTGIRTIAGTEFQLAYIELGGTLCQPAYDCPPHLRKYDALMVADSWSDVVAGGYAFGGPPAVLSGTVAAQSTTNGSAYVPLPRPILNRVPR